MDLGNIKPKSDVVVIELKHPSTGEVLTNDEDNSPMTITVCAPHTKEYKGRIFRMSQERLKKSAVAKSEDMDFEDIYSFSVDFLVDMTSDWNITFNGKSPKFDKKIAKDLYDNYVWVKEQVEFELNSFDAFTKD
jgi:hypothetical protein